MKDNPQQGQIDIFNILKDNILNIDPVIFAQNNLTIDGDKFKIEGGGYRPFADIYRYIALKAIEPDAMPVVLVKGRQVGATTMAAALECYFMACGLYGNNNRYPMRIAHLFPTLSMAAVYTKTKFDPMVKSSKPMPGILKSNGLLKSFVEAKLDTSSPANDNLQFKLFKGGNQIFIESTGIDGDRIRGRTIDCAFFDECFPYDQEIETVDGKLKIGILYDKFKSGKKLPLVKTYNEKTGFFEYKKILNAWNRGEKKLVKLVCNNGIELKCTGNHCFLTFDLSINKWKKCENLIPVEDIIRSTNDSFNKLGLAEVKEIQILNEKENVYDIEVEDNHNFIVNGLIAHNCQDIPSVAIGAVTKILAQAHYGNSGSGVQVYFGTPKQKGTNYYNMWKMSKQHYFHLRCDKCDKLFPLYRPDVNWEDIWLYGFIVKCTHCSYEQDKRKAAENGQWVCIGGAEVEDAKYIGYHINQLYIPTFTKETILDQKPEREPNNTERIYQNEVLGEFYDGEGALISQEEIHDKCADIERFFTGEISTSENKRVYAGFDWGQKGDLDQMSGKQRGQSYSCGVILTAEENGRFVIEFATRLKRNDLQSKIEVVDEMFRRYSVHVGVGDIGDAHDLTHALQRKYLERFLAARAAPKVIGHIKYMREIFPSEIVFERDYYYSEVIGLLKSGAIRFPYGQFEQISWLINHCCSMDIKVGQTRQGDPLKRYVKGTAPNDGFVALLNAYLAYKFHVTQGFKIRQPQFMKFDLARKKKKISAIVGYTGGLRKKT